MPKHKKLAILSGATAILIAGIVGAALGSAWQQDAFERFIFSYQGDVSLEINRDMETVVELGENIRTGTDPAGNPRPVSNVEVRMLAHVIRDEQIAFYARRWAVAYAGSIWQESAHVTDEQAVWLKDAVMHVWMHDPSDKMAAVAEWFLENDMGGLP